MNYVSCSPFRVPIARLAAAQAAVKEAKAAKSGPGEKAARPRNRPPRSRGEKARKKGPGQKAGQEGQAIKGKKVKTSQP